LGDQPCHYEITPCRRRPPEHGVGHIVVVCDDVPAGKTAANRLPMSDALAQFAARSPQRRGGFR
jgi:hypothetical protein